MSSVDPEFYERADAHIDLSNSQITDTAGRGKVSASNMYGMARFNAWVVACNCESAAEMSADKEKAIEYFTEQYRQMLADHIDDYIENFNGYMIAPGSDESQ